MKQFCRFVYKPNEYSRLRGALKSCYWNNLGFCPNQVDPPSSVPPPPSQKVGLLKIKNEVFCILSYSCILSILFFSHFHHIYVQFQGKFSFGKNYNNLGSADPPPPPGWKRIPSFSENKF